MSSSRQSFSHACTLSLRPLPLLVLLHDAAIRNACRLKPEPCLIILGVNPFPVPLVLQASTHAFSFIPFLHLLFFTPCGDEKTDSYKHEPRLEHPRSRTVPNSRQFSSHPVLPLLEWKNQIRLVTEKAITKLTPNCP